MSYMRKDIPDLLAYISALEAARSAGFEEWLESYVTTHGGGYSSPAPSSREVWQAATAAAATREAEAVGAALKAAAKSVDCERCKTGQPFDGSRHYQMEGTWTHFFPCYAHRIRALNPAAIEAAGRRELEIVGAALEKLAQFIGCPRCETGQLFAEDGDRHYQVYGKFKMYFPCVPSQIRTFARNYVPAAYGGQA